MNYPGFAVKLLLPVIFPALLFAQHQNSVTQLSASIPHVSADSSEEINLLRDRALWKENISERTVFSSSYVTSDGKYISHFSKSPLNYYDETGALQKIVAEPKSTVEGWSAKDQPYPTYLFNDGSAAVSPSKNLKFTFGKNIRVNGNSIADRVPVMNGKVATIQNIIPGMNKEFEFRMNGIKYNYILNQPMQTVNGFLSITEDLEIPAGYFLKQKADHGRIQDGGWCGDYELISPSGEVASVIYAPLIFDDANNWVLGTYKLKNTNGITTLELLVPASWLNDPARNYGSRSKVGE
ncbi:hypothetical protein BH09BAC5_BH09BAC5_29270 [soil metagenome]